MIATIIVGVLIAAVAVVPLTIEVVGTAVAGIVAAVRRGR